MAYPAPQPGWCVGPRNSPDEYTLVEPVTTGGEGDVWRARRLEPDGRPRGGDWAIKMLLPGHPAVTKSGVDPEILLRQWDERWYKNQLDTSDLRAIPGVVVPTQTFNGPAPHPPGRDTGERGLYMATPWVDGSDLRRWREGADRHRLPEVVEALCRIVDDLHDHGRIHGDISPGNVIAGPDGRVSLIDFTFMRFTELSRTTIALTPGYGAPESRDESTMATDAFAVAAVAYFLMTGLKIPVDARSDLPTRDAAQVAGRVLAGRGWSPAVAAHVAAALSPDPSARPVPLRPWGERLASLIGADATRVTCVDIVSDALNRPVVLTGSLLGLTASGPWDPPPGGPSGVVDVAAETDGHGALVVFALDAHGTLWSAARGRWHRLPGPAVRGPLAVVRTINGAVACLSLSDDRLSAHRLHPGKTEATQDVAEGFAPDSVLQAATIVPDGSVAILIRDRSGLYCYTHPSRASQRVLAAAPRTAALGLSQWDDLEVLAVDDRSGGLLRVEQLSDSWDLPEPVLCDVPVDHLAFLDHREGRTIAVAGPRGLWVSSGTSWQPLSQEPATRVVLKPTRSWRNQLVALLDGRVASWTEDHAKRWTPHDLR